MFWQDPKYDGFSKIPGILALLNCGKMDAIRRIPRKFMNNGPDLTAGKNLRKMMEVFLLMAMLKITFQQCKSAGLAV